MHDYKNNHQNASNDNDLPSVSRLIKSTIAALILAAIVLVTAVLPGEYGIDPTGIGNILGLTKMGQIKMSLAKEAALEEQNAVVAGVENKQKEPEIIKPTTYKSDSITVSLKPDEGREVKVTMLKGAKVKYRWVTSNDRANFDVHGDSKKLNIKYFNYSKGSSETDEGLLEAEFDGSHGWFWRNRSGKNMTITLEVEGEFSEMMQKV